MWLLLQTCYCEGNREKFHTTENMAKKVLPHHAADIEAIVTEYLQKWEETSNNDTALITDEEREQASEGGLLASDRSEARDGAVFRDEELDASEKDDTALTDENIVQDNQSPLLTSETSPQSLNETTGIYINSKLTKYSHTYTNRYVILTTSCTCICHHYDT